MAKLPEKLKLTIGRNILGLRCAKYPNRGGGTKMANEFNVALQQWSPWEKGKRTPDESRLAQIAAHFGVDVEWLRRDHGPTAEDATKAYKAHLNTLQPQNNHTPETDSITAQPTPQIAQPTPAKTDILQDPASVDPKHREIVKYISEILTTHSHIQKTISISIQLTIPIPMATSFL